MNGMKLSRTGLGILAGLLIATTSVSAFASPQRYWPADTNRKIVNLIRDTEERSGGLRAAFGRSESEMSGARVERAKARIRDLDEALKRLRYMVGHRGTRAAEREKVNEAISQANSIDRIFDRRPDIKSPLWDRWDGLKRDLNDLASIFGVPGVGD